MTWRLSNLLISSIYRSLYLKASSEALWNDRLRLGSHFSWKLFPMSWWSYLPLNITWRPDVGKRAKVKMCSWISRAFLEFCQYLHCLAYSSSLVETLKQNRWLTLKVKIRLRPLRTRLHQLRIRLSLKCLSNCLRRSVKKPNYTAHCWIPQNRWAK